MAVETIDARIREERRRGEHEAEPASVTLLQPRLVIRSSSRPVGVAPGG
jgi:hypothetical protein